MFKNISIRRVLGGRATLTVVTQPCEHCGTLVPQDPEFPTALCTHCWMHGAAPMGAPFCIWPDHELCGAKAMAARQRNQRFARGYDWR